MSEYQNSKIYKIISDNTNMIYIGSSYEPRLSRRLARHKMNYNDWLKDNNKTYITSYEILKLDNYSIVLLENYSCNNRDELIAREQYYIDLYKNDIINKNNTIADKDYQKNWVIKNKDIIKEKKHLYYENNKDKIAEKEKLNKDHRNEIRKKWILKNKEKINLKQKERRNKKKEEQISVYSKE